MYLEYLHMGSLLTSVSWGPSKKSVHLLSPGRVGMDRRALMHTSCPRAPLAGVSALGNLTGASVARAVQGQALWGTAEFWAGVGDSRRASTVGSRLLLPTLAPALLSRVYIPFSGLLSVPSSSVSPAHPGLRLDSSSVLSMLIAYLEFYTFSIFALFSQLNTYIS